VCRVGVLGRALAQAPGTPEPLGAWPFFKVIQAPRNYTGLLEFVLDRETLDQARADQSDLRLYDSAGREIPYALRLRQRGSRDRALSPLGNSTGGLKVAPLNFLRPRRATGATTTNSRLKPPGTISAGWRRSRAARTVSPWSKLVSDAILFRFARAAAAPNSKRWLIRRAGTGICGYA